MNAIARVAQVSMNAVTKLLIDGGEASLLHHDNVIRNINAQFIQADEMVGYIHCRQINLPNAKAADANSGDIWTWTALDPESKLMVSWHLGGRGLDDAYRFIEDLQSRLAGRIQLTTDGHIPYPDAIWATFGRDIDYAQSIGAQGLFRPIIGQPQPSMATTSHVERHNLTMRMNIRRLARRTNAFSKKLSHHRAALALYFHHYNFIRKHQSLGTAPAVAAGLREYPMGLEDLVEMIYALHPIRPRGRYRPRRTRTLQTT